MKLKLIKLFSMFLLVIFSACSVALGNGLLSLGLPADCLVGKTCWLVNLVDLDDSEGVIDYTCDTQSYNGHKGTDIGIRDLKAMRKGVHVLASETGVVKAIRDGVRDWDMSRPQRKNFFGKECGNGVVLSHGDGWETQYCHLKNGSLLVRKGQKVSKGDKLGLIGLSGKTEFPHIHLAVRRWGNTIDPFIGSKQNKKCFLGSRPLWSSLALSSLVGPLTTIFNSGFSGEKPGRIKINKGLYSNAVLSKKSKALVLWAELIRPVKGNKLGFSIFDPNGKKIFNKIFFLKKSQAVAMFFGGLKLKHLSWPVGSYKGEVALTYQNVDGVPIQQLITNTIRIK